MGLVTTAALRHLTNPEKILIGARYPIQKELAEEFGADVVCAPDELLRAVRSTTGSFMIGSRLSGGADVVIDAVGSNESIASAIAMCRPRGRVVLVGMPGVVEVDLTALWHRETELIGTYTYGTEVGVDGSTTTSFAMAMELANKVPFDKMVGATYGLDRYVDAIDHAANAGRRGVVKVAFDLRDERHRHIRSE
jgi:threonine dehydrogenase-like Zn-dependent dehydrogenase